MWQVFLRKFKNNLWWATICQVSFRNCQQNPPGIAFDWIYLDAFLKSGNAVQVSYPDFGYLRFYVYRYSLGRVAPAFVFAAFVLLVKVIWFNDSTCRDRLFRGTHVDLETTKTSGLKQTSGNIYTSCTEQKVDLPEKTVGRSSGFTDLQFLCVCVYDLGTTKKHQQNNAKQWVCR